MKFLLGYFIVKVDMEDIFKHAIGDESLHEINNDNGVGVVNFVISKKRTVKRSTLLTFIIYLDIA
jgi:hypothetical protein